MTKIKPSLMTAEECEAHAGKWLADANEQAEKGKKERAEKMYQKAQYWFDLANKARGWA